MSQTVSYSTDTPQPTLEEAAAALDAAAANPTAAAPSATPDPRRPAWLPENFKTAEDFRKSYDEGRAELTRAQQELATFKKPAAAPEAPKPGDLTVPADAPKTAAELAAAPPAEQVQAAAEAVAKTNLDMTPFQDEFARTGDISAENRSKIAEALKGQFGDSATALVDGFIAGQKATVEATRAKAFEAAGGQEQYASMTQWAKGNMTQGQLKAYNDAVSSSNQDAVLLAIQGLRANFERANGRAPTLVPGNGQPAGNEATQPFASTRQMTDAINDPRYSRDEAYRAEVVRRIQMSNL